MRPSMAHQSSAMQLCASALWVLLAALLAPHCGTCNRSLAQSPSGAPTSPIPSLILMLGQGSIEGPYFYKSIEAMVYTVAASEGRTTGLPVDTAVLVPISTGGQILAVWSANASAVYLGFVGTPHTLANVTAHSPLEHDAFYNDLFSDTGNGTINGPASNPFRGLLGPPGQNGLTSVITNVSGSRLPARIGCTGYAEGGALAKLGATWAGAAYPNAQVRSITFGAPRVGDARFNWAFQQLVDLRYDWAVHSDARVRGPAGSPQPDDLYFLAEDLLSNNASARPAGSLQYYVAALEENALNATSQLSVAGPDQNETVGPGAPTQSAGTAVVPAPPPGPGGFFQRLGSDIKQTFQGVGSILSAAASGVFRGDSSGTGALPFVNTTSEAEGACPALLCKVRPAARAACNAYNNGPGTIAPGSATISNPSTGTYVAVAWLGANSTAVFSFRGTTSTKDWLEDFQLWLNAAPLSPVLDELYPGARVHNGFLNQFEGVTDRAPDPSTNIKSVLLQLSDGTPPTKVVCTGHSLGGGVAALCGLWAALQWVGADVRVVTFGSPAAGNQQFAAAFKQAVGRSYRVVDRLDVVPSLPPFDSYVQLNYPLWIQENGTIIAEDRPFYRTSQLNWDDHACGTHKDAVYNVSHVSAPEWVTGIAPL